MSKVMISLPDEFLYKIDQVAKMQHRNRSEFFREAARFYLQATKTGINIPNVNPNVQRAVAIQDSLAAEDEADWDSTAEVRRWRDRK